MGALKYVNAVPKDVRYIGAAVNVLKYNGVVVWQRMDTYGITCVITGTGNVSYYDCNCGRDECSAPSDCTDCRTDCDCEHQDHDYDYVISITFTGVRRFPIKYVAKAGNTVSIEKSAVVGSGTTYTYKGSANVEGATSFSNASALEAVKSFYPVSGVSGWRSIGSISASYKNNGVSEHDHRTGQCDQCSGGGQCSDNDQCGGC